MSRDSATVTASYSAAAALSHKVLYILSLWAHFWHGITLSLSIYVGGYPAFSRQFSELCEQSSSASSTTSHVHISVSASLPISLHSSHKPKLKLQSAPADDSERYGPPVEILPHLILGCAKDSSDLLALQRLGVTAVLNVSHNCPSLFRSQFQYLEIQVPDTYQADILSRLDEAFAFIGEYSSYDHTNAICLGDWVET